MACFDISARKRMEEELQLSREQIERQLLELETVYQTAPVGLCFVGPELRYVRINAQLVAMHGLTVGEHIGRTLAEVISQLAWTMDPPYRDALQSGRPATPLEIRATTM